MDDPYDVLGVPADADEATIRAAYRKRAGEAHPDRGGDPQAMVAVNVAYDTLNDPNKRARWDAGGEDPAQIRLSNLFNSYLQDDHDYPGDLIVKFTTVVESAISDLSGIIARTNKRIAKLQRQQKRLKGPPLFERLIMQQLKNQQTTITGAEQEIAINRRVLELLAAYKDTAGGQWINPWRQPGDL